MKWDKLQLYPVPTDAEATEAAAREEAAAMLAAGHRTVYLCRNRFKNTGASLGERWFVLDQEVVDLVPSSDRYFHEVLHG